MPSLIHILKNYRIFASESRYQTAIVFLEELKRADKPNSQKLMMLKIVEEFVSSTEDLAMWLIAVSKRNQSNKYGLWEELLLADVPTMKPQKKGNKQDPVVQMLSDFRRLRKPSGLLKKLDIVNADQLTTVYNGDKTEIEESLLVLLKLIKATIDHRKRNSGILVRVHNKIKHGMTVYLDDENIDKLWIRDLTKVKTKKGSRIRNRFFDLGVNLKKAEEIVKNIQAVKDAIQALIGLVLADLEYRIRNDKKIRRKTREFMLNELNKNDFA